jgi:putative hemin transport protein
MPLALSLPEPADDLRVRWQALKTEQPRLRARDAADALGVSEAELVAAQCGVIARPLAMDIEKLFEGLSAVGRVMALTRNDSCVHERKGAYEPARFGPMAGIVLGPEIDLRIFPKHWAHLFAITDTSVNPARRSLQAFDANGTAIHKIFALDATDMAAWTIMVDDLAQSAPAALAVERAQPAERRLNAEPNRGALLADWSAIKDVHEFHGMLKKHEVDALQAMQLADGVYTQPLPATAANDLLTLAAERQVPIMVFVGNPGVIQIHTGPVSRIVRMDHWINVLDPDFNLHLREDHIAHAFVVTKPSGDGELHSVELFHKSGERIATFFGRRKPGEPELAGWRGIVSDLPRLKA